MFLRRLALTTLAAAGTVLLVAAPAGALPGFGTAPVSGGSTSGPQTVISSVTVGHHAGFDRVVFTFRGPLPRYEVRYVSQVRADASDRPVPLLGSAFLTVVIQPTAWTTAPSPQGTLTPRFPMLKQVKGAGEFEAVASYGLGAASRSGFRAFALTGPNRLVVDLAIPSGSTGSTGSSTGNSGSAGKGSSEGTSSAGSTGANPGGSTSTGTGGLAATGPANALPLTLGGLALVALGGTGLWLVRRRLAA